MNDENQHNNDQYDIEYTEQERSNANRQRGWIIALIVVIVIGLGIIAFCLIPRDTMRSWFGNDSIPEAQLYENTDSVKRPVQRSLTGEFNAGVPVDSDSLALAADTTVSLPLSKENAEEEVIRIPLVTKASKTFEINEYNYAIKYSVLADNGLLHCEAIVNDEKDVSDFPYNKYTDADKILNQFEGLVYFSAATDLGGNIVDKEGRYNDDYMVATLNLLRNSMDALGKGRGDSQAAAEGSRTVYNKLKALRHKTDDKSLKEIKATIWEMNEKPISTRQLRFE